MLKNCDHCGKEFKNRPRVKFCSPECSYKGKIHFRGGSPPKEDPRTVFIRLMADALACMLGCQDYGTWTLCAVIAHDYCIDGGMPERA